MRAMTCTAEPISPQRKIETDLGVEKFCPECREYWPLDDEFWYFQWRSTETKGKVKQYTNVCKACYEIKYRTVPRVRRYSAKSNHERQK